MYFLQVLPIDILQKTIFLLIPARDRNGWWPDTVSRWWHHLYWNEVFQHCCANMFCSFLQTVHLIFCWSLQHVASLKKYWWVMGQENFHQFCRHEQIHCLSRAMKNVEQFEMRWQFWFDILAFFVHYKNCVSENRKVGHNVNNWLLLFDRYVLVLGYIFFY